MKLSLIFIKSLMSSDWYNGDIDSSSKLSFFFMNLSATIDKDENLWLHLKSSESKGLSDKSISAFMKKDLFILKSNYELRKVIRMGKIVLKCFLATESLLRNSSHVLKLSSNVTWRSSVIFVTILYSVQGSLLQLITILIIYWTNMKIQISHVKLAWSIF